MRQKVPNLPKKSHAIKFSINQGRPAAPRQSGTRCASLHPYELEKPFSWDSALANFSSASAMLFFCAATASLTFLKAFVLDSASLRTLSASFLASSATFFFSAAFLDASSALLRAAAAAFSASGLEENPKRASQDRYGIWRAVMQETHPAHGHPPHFVHKQLGLCMHVIM